MKTRRKKEKQIEFDGVNGWGGKRRNAGRPNLSNQVNHMRRPILSIKTPLHITLRLIERLPSLRKKVLLKEFKESIRRAKALGLYIIHFSIQDNHIHLFAEARSNKAIALGMRALAGRFAKYIRSYAYKVKSAKSKGSVFAGRYHLHILKTPREVRNALEYVLLNLSKHRKLIEFIDEFSSGSVFRNWKALLGRRYKSLIRFDHEWYQKHERQNDLMYVLNQPRSWLAQRGWQIAQWEFSASE